MTKELIKTLSQTIAPAVNMLGYELWGCELSSHGRRGLLRVYIESKDGITIDDCEKVSRQISAILDVEDPMMGGAYDLEVSSPGFDRPLFTLDQYQRFVGQKIRVRLHAPKNERRNFAGILKAVEPDTGNIIMEGDEGETWTLPWKEIEKAHVVPKY